MRIECISCDIYQGFLHQATVCFALSQSAEQSPRNLPCDATAQFGATVQFTSSRTIIFTVVDVVEARGAPSYLSHLNISPLTMVIQRDATRLRGS